MKNFELIDDYLSNRLQGAEKEAFEKQLGQDPTLKSELAFQKQVVNGIRHARTAELKAMLNKVPVGGAVVQFSVMRMAAGVAGAALLAAGIYYYANRGEFPPIDKAATDMGGEVEKKPQEQPEPQQPADSSTNPQGEQNGVAPNKDNEKKPASKKTSQVTPVSKPTLDVSDPSADFAEDNMSNAPVATASYKPEVSSSSLQVELDSSNKNYDFHYQFVNGKLMLYGPFDKSLYEVLEVNGDQHAIFLVYQENYYLLDAEQSHITKLHPIRESKLISTLRGYRKI